MTKEQLEIIRHIAWSVETLGKEAGKALKKMDGVSSKQCEAVDVEVPEWMDEGRYETLHGDAGNANSDHFRVFVRRKGDEDTFVIVILCPTFLRGPLTITVGEHGIRAAY